MNRLARWDNPIFRREMRRLDRKSTGHRRRSAFIIVGLVGILASLFALLLWMYPTTYGQQFIWMFFPAWALWVIYAATVLQVIVTSIGTLSTEHSDQTWEPLVITGISTRRILLGNCLAVMHRNRGWVFFLALARIAVLPIYLLVSAKVADIACVGYCIRQSPTLTTWGLAIGITILLTILDILCCSMIGMAASGLTRHAGFAAAFAILVRFSPLIIFLAFGFDDSNFWAWWTAPPFALVDGGTAPAVQLIMPLLPYWVHFNPWLGLLLISSALVILLPIITGATLLIMRSNGGSAQRLRQ